MIVCSKFCIYFFNFYVCLQLTTINPDQVDAVGAAIANIVSDLNESGEQTADNLDIIANVYEKVDDLIQSGQVNVSEDVCEHTDKFQVNFACAHTPMLNLVCIIVSLYFDYKLSLICVPLIGCTVPILILMVYLDSDE